MKINMWKCDCCGAEISGNPLRVESYTVDRESEEPVDTYEILGEAQEERPIELCEECAEDIFATMWMHISESSKKRDRKEMYGEIADCSGEEKTAKEEKTTKIDKGKLRSLWEAGWSVLRLSEEFACSDQCIRDNMKKLGIWKPEKERKAEMAAKNEAKQTERLNRLELNVIEED